MTIAAEYSHTATCQLHEDFHDPLSSWASSTNCLSLPLIE
jgi:hypothetical protein